MVAKRIIPCLDIKQGMVVKGVNFGGLCDAGDPLALACNYVDEGADELVFLDIAATQENRKTMIDLVRRTASQVSIPFTVGGGIQSVADVARLLECGADKVSVNSSIIKNPDLLEDLALHFGSQCITIAIDARKVGSRWVVYSHGGTLATGLELFAWAAQCQELGAGELLFTSIDHDGTKNGFAIDALKNLHQALKIPIIASGGAGGINHFFDAFTIGQADATLAASVFHFGAVKIPQLKQFLVEQNVPIRP